MPDDEKLHRRQFFRRGLGELLKPLVQAIEPMERTLNQLSRLDEPRPAPKTIGLKLWLRPPGALAEKKFLETCSLRCGECVKVCPAEAIKTRSHRHDRHQRPLTSKPHRRQCVACDGLYCMASCPTGALRSYPADADQNGNPPSGKKASARARPYGTDCQILRSMFARWERQRFEVDGRGIRVKPLGCIGCGAVVSRIAPPCRARINRDPQVRQRANKVREKILSMADDRRRD